MRFFAGFFFVLISIGIVAFFVVVLMNFLGDVKEAKIEAKAAEQRADALWEAAEVKAEAARAEDESLRLLTTDKGVIPVGRKTVEIMGKLYDCPDWMLDDYVADPPGFPECYRKLKDQLPREAYEQLVAWDKQKTDAANNLILDTSLEFEAAQMNKDSLLAEYKILETELIRKYIPDYE